MPRGLSQATRSLRKNCDGVPSHHRFPRNGTGRGPGLVPLTGLLLIVPLLSGEAPAPGHCTAARRVDALRANPSRLPRSLLPPRGCREQLRLPTEWALDCRDLRHARSLTALDGGSICFRYESIKAASAPLKNVSCLPYTSRLTLKPYGWLTLF